MEWFWCRYGFTWTWSVFIQIWFILRLAKISPYKSDTPTFADFAPISHPCRMISVSKNFVGFFSIVNFMFVWEEFNFSKRRFVFLSSNKYAIYISFIKVWLHWSNDVFFHFRDINIWKNYRDGTSHRPTIWFYLEKLRNFNIFY